MNPPREHSEGVRRLKTERLNSDDFENMNPALIIVVKKGVIF